MPNCVLVALPLPPRSHFCFSCAPHAPFTPKYRQTGRVGNSPLPAEGRPKPRPGWGHRAPERPRPWRRELRSPRIACPSSAAASLNTTSREAAPPLPKISLQILRGHRRNPPGGSCSLSGRDCRTRSDLSPSSVMHRKHD